VLDPIWRQTFAIETHHYLLQVSDAKWQNRARGELGLLAGVNGDLASAALALQQAIGKAESLGDVAGQLHFTIWLANGMAHNGRPDAALRLLDRVTALAEKSGHEMPLDRHYKRLVGFAVLTSLFAAASEIAQNQNRSLLTYPSPAQVAGSAAGQQAADLGAQITRRNLNVQPTIKISVGYRFNVRVNRDILFDEPYFPVR